MFRTSWSKLLIAIMAFACHQYGIGAGRALSAEATIRNGSLPVAMNTLAQSVKGFCNSGKETVGLLKVKEFRPPERYKTSSGRTLRDLMTEALKKNGVTVDNSDFAKATHVIEGACIVDETQTEIVLKLIVILVTDRGIEVVGFRDEVKAVEVSDREAIVQTLGTTVDITPATTPKTVKDAETIAAVQETKFTESVKNPSVSITTNPAVANAANPAVGNPANPVNPATANPAVANAAVGQGARQTMIAPSLSSKFKVEILVRNAEKELVPTPAIDANGLAVVGLNAGDVFGIRIYNDFEIDVAVRLTLDGINSFALSSNPGFRSVGCWIIPSKSARTVEGWHLNAAQIQEFLVTDYPESIAKRLGGPAEGIGVIQAQFFSAWAPGDPVPFQEQQAIATKAGSLATGAGNVIASESKTLTRIVGKTLLGAISVRYSRPELPTDLPKDAPPK